MSYIYHRLSSCTKEKSDWFKSNILILLCKKPIRMKEGVTIWITGYSGSGKTTLAEELQKKIIERAIPCEVLDGDIIRKNLSKGLNFSKEDTAFRDEVRTFIADNYPSEMRVPNPETDLTKEQSLLWHRILYKKGWIAPSWPREYGGPGWTITQRYIFEQETSRAGTLPPLPGGDGFHAPHLEDHYRVQDV